MLEVKQPMNKTTKILFFIASAVPTEAEYAAAKKLGTGMFRNASQITKDENPERCDFVAGCVPSPSRYEDLPRLGLDGEPVAPAPAVAASEPAAESAAPAPVVANPPDFVPPAASAAEQRAAEDEGARKATVAQLKAALQQLGIEFKSNASKAELLALFLNR